MINRRGLIIGLISFVAAPAIVRASGLMPVKVMDDYFVDFQSWPIGTTVSGNCVMGRDLYWRAKKMCANLGDGTVYLR